MMDAIYIFNQHYGRMSYDLWSNLCRLLEWLRVHWQEPDAGIWEVPWQPKKFVHSRLMSWVAFDRAVRLARLRGLAAPVDQWMKVSAQIYKEIMEQGWNERKQSFVQYYGGETIDASALLMVLTKCMSPYDPRMVGTIDRVQQELTRDAFVVRYDPTLVPEDHLGEVEGTFSLCSFWLIEALTHAGRLNEARLLLDILLSYSNHVGLYAEGMSPLGGALGNYPQAFTHLSLISTCSTLDQALGTSRG